VAGTWVAHKVSPSSRACSFNSAKEAGSHPPAAVRATQPFRFPRTRAGRTAAVVAAHSAPDGCRGSRQADAPSLQGPSKARSPTPGQAVGAARQNLCGTVQVLASTHDGRAVAQHPASFIGVQSDGTPSPRALCAVDRGATVSHQRSRPHGLRLWRWRRRSSASRQEEELRLRGRKYRRSSTTARRHRLNSRQPRHLRQQGFLLPPGCRADGDLALATTRQDRRSARLTPGLAITGGPQCRVVLHSLRGRTLFGTS